MKLPKNGKKKHNFHESAEITTKSLNFHGIIQISSKRQNNANFSLSYRKIANFFLNSLKNDNARRFDHAVNPNS